MIFKIRRYGTAIMLLLLLSLVGCVNHSCRGEQDKLDQCIRDLKSADSNVDAIVMMKCIESIPICEEPSYWVKLANDDSQPNQVRTVAIYQLFIRFVKVPIKVRQLCLDYHLDNWFSENNVLDHANVSASIFDTFFKARPDNYYEAAHYWPQDAKESYRVILRMNKFIMPESYIKVARGEYKDDELTIIAIHIPTSDGGVILYNEKIYRINYKSLLNGIPKWIESCRIISDRN